jgi:hypothetical protein
MNSPARVRPKYLGYYADELDAQNICAALKAYGIEAFYNRGTLAECNRREDGLYSCIYVANEADFEKAREFKRGLLAALRIRSHPEAFLHGVQAAAQIMGSAIKRRTLNGVGKPAPGRNRTDVARHPAPTGKLPRATTSE